MADNVLAARRRLALTNSLGLHLRAAARFAKLAESFQSEIRVESRGRSANGKSALELVSLAAQRGTMLDLEARGPDAPAALAGLADLVLAGFHESEGGEEPHAT